MRMELRELPEPKPYPRRVLWEGEATVTVVQARSHGRITSFDTTPGPPVPWWRQWWWRVRSLWPIYRCRHDR